jgi:CRP-like cAMP-binding protein
MDETRLGSIELFESLPADARRAIAQHADELDIPEGTELARQGDFAYEFFVIEDGTAEVLRDGERIAELGPGDFLGEIAALERGRRNASVIARLRMSLVVMNARDLRQLADAIPRLGETVRAVAAERHPLA